MPSREPRQQALRSTLFALSFCLEACVVAGSAAGRPAPEPPKPRAQSAGVSQRAAPAGATTSNRNQKAPPSPDEVANFKQKSLPLPEKREEPELYPFNEPLPGPVLPPNAPALRIANLSPAQCRAEVKRRKLPFKRDRRPTPGVATALRFTEPIHEVTFLAAGYRSKFGVMDCRLALAFVQLAEVLYAHGVTRMEMGTIYRIKAKLPSHKPSQHAHGLAADVVGFKLYDDRELVVERDWQGEIGAPACGPDASLLQTTENSVTLRNLVCEIARRGIFHHLLTPNFNRAHHDHLHVDVKRDAKRWQIH